MTLDRKEKGALSDTRFEKAREFLADARANLKDGRYRTAVNRAYCAVLNAARALLILDGANSSTHEGTATLISLKFVKTGLLPVEVAKKFKTLLSRRTDVDYGDFDSIDAAEAEDSLKLAEDAVREIDAIRTRMISELNSCAPPP